MLRTLSGCLALTRPKQWTKNLLVFAGVLFTNRLDDLDLVANAVLAFCAFCAASGLVYTINDLRDVERDRAHPRKRLRPLASGAVGARAALGLGAVLGVFAGLAAWALGPIFAACIGGYVVLNLAYTVVTKHLVLLDMLSISSGFLLRALAGIAVVWTRDPSAEVTPWFLGCAFFLSLLLIIGKRRHETVSLGETRATHRPVLAHYSERLLDQLLAVTTTLTIGSYTMWTTLGRFRDQYLIATVPFVVYGVFRYLYLVYHRDGGGAPEELLLGDRALLVDIALWGATVVVLLNLEW